MNTLVRPQIEGIVEYTLKQFPHRVKLNQNENPYELPPDIKRDILERMASERWSRYPAFVPRRQMEKLAAFTGWKTDGVLLGNGSNDLLQLLFTCVLGAGRGVVISQPTFTLYKLLAQSLGAAVHEVPMRRPFAFDVDAIIATQRRTRSSLVLVCSPNNPTGTQLPAGDIVRILESTDALVAVDEAYVQFAPESAVRLLAEQERLVVLQTFSKAMGAAGLRFGYALLDPHLASQLNKVKLPYAVNIFSLLAAEVLMDRWNELKGWIDTIAKDRDRMREVLNGLPGIVAYPSAANFLLFESERKTAAEIFDAVLAAGVLIRNVSSYPMLGRALRVSIGTPEENHEFLTALRSAL